MLLRGIISLGLSGDTKARAAGYSHVYFSGEIDAAVLSRLPSNTTIDTLNATAFEEQDSLWDLLGVNARNVLQPTVGSRIVLPSVSSWWPGNGDSDAHLLQDDPFDFSWDVSEPTDEDDTRSEEPDELEGLIDRGLSESGRTMKEDNRIEQLAYAAVMLTMDETGRMYVAHDAVSPDISN